MNKHFNTLTLSILCLLISSCNQTSSPENIFLPAQETLLSSKKEINLMDMDILDPTYVYANKNKVLIIEDKSTKMMTVIDTDSNASFCWGNKGEGPEDFVQISSATITQTNKNTIQVGAYDSSLRRYLETYFTENGIESRIKWSIELFLDVVRPICGGKHYACSAVGNENSFYIINDKGEVVNSNNTRPKKPESVSDFSHSLACSGSLAASVSQPYFAQSVIYDGGINFFKVENDSIKNVWSFTSFDMDYDIIPEYNNVPVPNQKSRYGYTSLYMTDKYLFGLYSGKLILTEDSEMSNEIHVFDKEGNHCTKYLLDKPVYEFTIDEPNHTLYALSRDNNDAAILYSYELE